MRKQFKKASVFLIILCILALQLTGVIKVVAFDSGQGSGEAVFWEEDGTEKRQNDGGEMPDIIAGTEDDEPTGGEDESVGNESTEDEDSTEDEPTESDSAEDGSTESVYDDNNMEETEYEDLINAIAEGNTRTVYFDAALSRLSYTGDDMAGSGLELPADGAGVSYHAWVNLTQESTDGEMVLVTEMDTDLKNRHTWNALYKAEIDKKYDRILFYRGSTLSANTAGTVDLEIPKEDEYKSPCFYADTGDDVVYGAAKYRRSGYWGEVDGTHNAEEGKGTDVVNILSGEFKRDFQTYYAKVTLYDYYTDYELNGNNRDSYPSGYREVNSHRIYQPFRQFDQALSDYYRKEEVSSPLYWGNFQNFGGQNPHHFNDIEGTLNLYDYDRDGNTDKFKKFFYENNSMWGRYGQVLGSGANATQGLVSSSLQDGTLMLGTNVETNDETNGDAKVKVKVTAPFFDEEFLRGNNSKNTVLGEVYHDVAFPFVQQEISGIKNVKGLTASGKVYYWYFNSMDNNDSTANKNLILRWDETLGLYYLESSENVVKGAIADPPYVTANGNFFPLNESGQSGDAGRLNYGFAQKMEIDFRVTKDGTVRTTDGDQVPIRFHFQGDDDVWVFIDDKLVLDVGGDHGIVEGTINFYTKKAMVSSVKNSTADGSTPNIEKDLSDIMDSTFYQNEHKLTMFYIERGLWESNLYILFNFSDESLFSVEKEVDTSEVNKDLFNKELLDKLLDKPFTFNIKNQATHYQTYSGGESGGFVVSQGDIKDYGSVASGKLENAAGAVYNISDSSGAVDGTGNFKLKHGQTAVFSNQFRRGSYIYLKENVDEDLFRTTWELYDEDKKVSTTAVPSTSKFVSGGKELTGENTKGTTVSDGRLEEYLTSGDIGVGGVANSGYTEKGPAKTENGTTDQTLIFRSYDDPDNTLGLNVKVKEINTVRTGAITVKKEKTDASEDLGEEEFSFTVRFTDVAGMKLEGDSPKELTFTLKAGKEKEITGIPAGTAYTITEAASEGYTLESVRVESGNDTEIKVGTKTINGDETVDVSEENGITVTGVVTADDGADPEETFFTFENEKMTGSIDILKKGAAGPMEGVEFALFDADGNAAKDVKGNELKGVTASDGTLSFSGIPAGTGSQPKVYYLRETKTIQGYELMRQRIEVILPYVYHAGDIVNGQKVEEDGVTWHVSYTIINDRVFDLPSAGQRGAVDYVFFGTMLLCVTTGIFSLLLFRVAQTNVQANTRQKAVSARRGWLPKGISCQSPKDD